jgi:RNA polymerase sigma factor (TIGR02999 family)
MWVMSEVTQLLLAINLGDEQATAELFPIVYAELQRLARAQMANERAGHTLQATSLVHEAYLRLVGRAEPRWDGRGHFFAAAAEAMRRILVDHARSKNAAKRGGNQQRLELLGDGLAVESSSVGADDLLLLALDEALTRLALEAPEKAQLIKLRYFAGLTIDEAADAMQISRATAKRYWVSARAWLYQELMPEA